MKNSTPKLVLAGVIAVASLVSAGVASASPSSRTTYPTCSSKYVSTSSSPIHITFWEGMPQGIIGTGNYGALHALVTAFNASQSKIIVNDVNQSGGYSQTWNSYYTSLSNHTSPNVVMFDQYNTQGAADTKSILPISTCVAATGFKTAPFLPKVLGAYKVGTTLTGMPYSASVPVMYYNQKAFTQAHIASPPKTMTQLIADQKLLQKTFWMKGAVKTFYKNGVSIKYDAWEVMSWLGLADKLVVNNGNGHTSRARTASFNNSTTQQYLQALQNIAKNAGGNNVYNPSATSLNVAYGNLFDVANGLSGITFDTTAALGTIQSYLGLYPNVTLGVAPLPSLTGANAGSMPSGGNGLFINKSNSSAAQQAASWVFIQYLTTAANLASWDKQTGYLPIRTDEVAKWKASLTANQFKWYNVGYTSLVTGKVDTATMGPLIGSYNAVANDISGALQAVLTSPYASPTSALSSATTKANHDMHVWDSALGL